MNNMRKDKLVVEGLAGKKALNGVVDIKGAKNAALKAMAAAVLFGDPVTLKNVPNIEDIKKLSDLMIVAGAKIENNLEHGTLTIDTSTMNETELDFDLAQSMRGSVMLTGPMLARLGKVTFPIPGGCVIGARPINLYVSAYESMGAHVKLDGEKYVITAGKAGEGKGGLHGAEIFFDIQTVGGTETLMMAAVLANGTTVLKNCAMEPEIVSLAEYLNDCGADIRGVGTTTIEIVGRAGKLLHSKGKAYITIPDRIETAGFLLLGAVCADNLKINHCNPAHLESVIQLLRKSGVNVLVGEDGHSLELRDNAKVKLETLSALNIRTHEYPGFPTDVQAPMAAYLTQVTGDSVIFETIYEGRFKFIQNLEQLGAGVTIMNPREILVRGVTANISGGLRAPLAGEELDAYDIRAGFATIIVALIAKGTSVIKNAYYIDRGYEDIEGRLSALGANVRRVHGEE